MTKRAPGPAPFEAAAATYDDAFTRQRVPRLLRERVWERLERTFRAGDRVLDLGCGTGEDAVHLARRGVRVTAVDQSPAMLEAARRKAMGAGRDVVQRIELRLVDLSRDPLPSPPGGGDGLFDGAFSSFGALNCVADRPALAAKLADRLRPGAPLILVVMGPFCPWEMVWYLVRLSPGTAFRRLRGSVVARVGNPPIPVRVWYPTARRLGAELSPGFRRRKSAGLGVVLPPPYLAHLVEGRPRLLDRLATWDRRLGGHFPGTWLNDHYLLHLERKEES